MDRRGVFISLFHGQQVHIEHGITVSAPSWCVLETGSESIIRGNVEFDRYSPHAYDYLNFFPFYFRNARSQQVDMPGVEALDGVGVPLLADAFPEKERYQGFQLYQRGVSWVTLRKSLDRSLNPHSVRNLVDEWLVGLQVGDSVNQETEAELIEKLKDSRIRYLDLFHTEFDHVAHLTHDRRILLNALRGLDSLIGRIWTAIESSSLADETVLVVVSDHGINNDPGVFGQGWNLVDALRSAAGGGHHVITNRHLRSDYKIRGLNPFVNEVTNESADSFYLKGAASSYPTALVDPDGNERACVYLRNSAWNELQILRQQLRRRDLSEPARKAAVHAVHELVERNSAAWSRIGGESAADLDRVQPVVDSMKGTERQVVLAGRAEEQLRAYREYLRSVSGLLTAPESADQGIPRRAMGALNSIHQLQNYAVGLAPGGLALAEDGSIDWQRSFRRMDYFAYFTGIQVRNAPQPAVGVRPVDFVAARVPREELVRSLAPELSPDADGVWLYKD